MIIAAVKVEVYYNTSWPDALIRGYQKGDKILKIDDIDIPVDKEMSDEDILETVFSVFNGMDDFTYPFSSLNIRSMSVGDIVLIDNRVYSCESQGWKERFE